jgi:hypothetical protein
MGNIEPKDISGSAIEVGQKITEVYWTPLYKYLKANSRLIEAFTGFLLNHEKLIFYFGRTHLAIEYIGPERINELKSEGQAELRIFDYTLKDGNFFEQIVGFKFDGTSKMEFPLPPYAEDLIIPTNKGMDELVRLHWNFAAQNSLISINTKGFIIQEGSFTRLVNTLLFDADEKGLKTRHIKWIDFLPLEYDDTGEIYDSFKINLGPLAKLVEHDAHYIYPLPYKEDFKFTKLPQINRFIELSGRKGTAETDITSFLEKEENKFILSMAFLAKEIHPQVICKWQSEVKDDIKPDFFIVQPNGYANIVEFKLPFLKTDTVVGKSNRETFSAELNSYISQTRTYKTYFEDPNNRKWVEQKYGFKVHNPKRILVIGRRWDFESDEWREIIADYRDIEIMTYDDLVGGVIAQFYL